MVIIVAKGQLDKMKEGIISRYLQYNNGEPLFLTIRYWLHWTLSYIWVSIMELQPPFPHPLCKSDIQVMCTSINYHISLDCMLPRSPSQVVPSTCHISCICNLHRDCHSCLSSLTARTWKSCFKHQEPTTLRSNWIFPLFPSPGILGCVNHKALKRHSVRLNKRAEKTAIKFNYEAFLFCWVHISDPIRSLYCFMFYFYGWWLLWHLYLPRLPA